VITLVSLLKEGLDRVGGSQAALAIALGLSRPRVTRLLQQGERGYPLGVKACFALADLVNRDYVTVLRLANKGWMADILEKIGVSKQGSLQPEYRSLLGNYAVVKKRAPRTAERVRALLEELATDARGRPIVPARRKSG
jgi:hypothetical protein